MGSESDLPVMQEAIDILRAFNIETEIDIVSAHRTPEKMMDYGTQAHLRGIKVIIAGAGGRRPPAWDDCIGFTPTRDRCTRKIE